MIRWVEKKTGKKFLKQSTPQLGEPKGGSMEYVSISFFIVLHSSLHAIVQLSDFSIRKSDGDTHGLIFSLCAVAGESDRIF